jgi:hypothetical protein
MGFEVTGQHGKSTLRVRIDYEPPDGTLTVAESLTGIDLCEVVHVQHSCGRGEIIPSKRIAQVAGAERTGYARFGNTEPRPLLL